METIISDLLKHFERGALTRRELIGGLALLTAAGHSASAAEAQQTGLKATTINHISIQVSDLPRSVAFYQNVFSLSVVSQDEANEIVRLGTTGTLISLHHKSPTGLVDHFAIGVSSFDMESATRDLRAHGLTPEQNLDAGFHVKDPEGISVQIVQS